jgi:hypothetical protein
MTFRKLNRLARVRADKENTMESAQEYRQVIREMCELQAKALDLILNQPQMAGVRAIIENTQAIGAKALL